MRVHCSHLVLAAILWAMPCTRAAVAVTNTTELSPLTVAELGIELNWRNRSSSDVPHSRRKRYISSRDMMALLDYHNRVRSQVFPPAANMEYMVVHLLLKYFKQYFHSIFFKSLFSVWKGVEREACEVSWIVGLKVHMGSWATTCHEAHGPEPVHHHRKVLKPCWIKLRLDSYTHNIYLIPSLSNIIQYFSFLKQSLLGMRSKPGQHVGNIIMFKYVIDDLFSSI